MASLWMILASLACAGLAAADTQTADLDFLANAATVFSRRLHHKLAVVPDEAVFSPYSIHSALSMTSLGARGRTWAEMMTQLGLSGMPNGPHNAYHNLIAQMNNVTDVHLYTGNGIFTNPNLRIKADFVSDVQKQYFAKAEEFDWIGGPERQINNYIESSTNDMIKNVIPDNSITADTLMLLVNTIFFNGTWATPFPEYMTSQKNFTQPIYNTNGSTMSTVDMMRDDRYIAFKTDDSLKADMVRLPFKGKKRFAMYILLPRAMDGIYYLEQMMANGAPAANTVFDGYRSLHMHVEIPKFKIESSFKLADVLKQLGMVAAFDASLADFSGMTPENYAHITSVVHKAVIDVQESGTTAAAATVVSVGIESVMIPQGTFKADHPFLFYLRDDQTKQVLFQGKFSG